MQCEKFEARLQDLLDQRERPEFDAKLLEHAEDCDACRETLTLQERLFTGLEVWEMPEISQAFASRVVAQHCSEVAEKAASPQTRSTPWRFFVGVLAASLLVAVVATAMRWNAATVQQPPTVVVNKPAIEPAVSIHPAPVQPVAPSVNVFPDQFAMQFVSTAPEFLDGQATGRMIREVTTSLPEVALVEDNIPAIRPITSSFGVTIGMVRRTLPGGQDASERTAPKQQPVVKPQADAGFSAPVGIV